MVSFNVAALLLMASFCIKRSDGISTDSIVTDTSQNVPTKQVRVHGFSKKVAVANRA
jgi:hypothetical protein